MRTIAWLIVLMILSAESAGCDSVVLLHGLARSSRSMAKLEVALERERYRVINVDYDSTSHPVEALAAQVRQAIMERRTAGSRVHFVTHSMGGILVRQIQKSDPMPDLGRVVMIAPPNHGSEVVDALRDNWFFKALNGPAGQQLGTEADGLIAGLGPVAFELGIIAGDRSWDPILPRLIPGANDGKVSLSSARVSGMMDFLVVPYGHTFVASKEPVIAAAIRFLREGRFSE